MVLETKADNDCSSSRGSPTKVKNNKTVSNSNRKQLPTPSAGQAFPAGTRESNGKRQGKCAYIGLQNVQRKEQHIYQTRKQVLNPKPQSPTGVPDLNPETSRGSHASDVCGYLIIDLRPAPDRVPCKSQVEVRWGEVTPIFSIV